MKIARLRASRVSSLTSMVGATTLIASLAFSPAARADMSFAPSGADFTIGDGNNVTIYGAALRWDSLCACPALKQYGFETRLVAQLAYWHGRENPAVRSSLWDASVMPMLRWMGPTVGAIRPFAELGIGAHLLSATRINTERNFGSSFQFGEVGEIGFAFGERQRYELGAYIQHVSNGGVKQPNNGITYFGAVLRVPLPWAP